MHSTPQPFVSIVGAGAIGQAVAAAMCAAGSDVRMLTRNAESALRLEGHGILRRSDEGSLPPVRPSVLRRPEDVSGSSLIIVCVKCHQTIDAITPLRPHIDESTPIILLQNGAGAYDEAAVILPSNPIFCGIIRFGAFIGIDGVLTQYGEPAMTLVPRPGTSCAASIDTSLLPGIDVAFETKSKSLIWSKLCLNCGINPTTAINNICNGELPDNSLAWQTAVEAASEASAVAEAAGIDLTYTDIEKELRSICDLTAGNHSSMRQDLEMQRSTEIEYINGYIIRQADILGVSVPANIELRERIKALEPNDQ